ncbi:hypothetical protein INT45_009063 [Circinella minor]|uniref:Uncharacterized protein n=1 Tax=Circinella minor TaxID=1195481 RepID=A0A8H7SA16_9FUNG|nr:hypothetical protein INT45_009063 [Circinella minor]
MPGIGDKRNPPLTIMGLQASSATYCLPRSGVFWLLSSVFSTPTISQQVVCANMKLLHMPGIGDKRNPPLTIMGLQASSATYCLPRSGAYAVLLLIVILINV